MGCDIHWHSETKRNGQWVCDQAHTFKLLEDENNYPEMDNFPGRNRDYWMFGLLQQVRNSYDWSFDERIEFPDDASSEVRRVFEYWGSDAHSVGYRTREELKAKLEELKLMRAQHLINPEKDKVVIDHHFVCLENMIGNLTSDVPDSDQRIVFWFDN
jgi:hypothetical protein